MNALSALINKQQIASGRGVPGGKLFLAVVPDTNLPFLLEAIFTANLTSQKNNLFRIEIVVHPDNKLLAESCSIFSGVHAVENNSELTVLLNQIKPDVLYIPDPELKVKVKGAFGSGKIRIGGKRNRLLSFLTRYYGRNDFTDLQRLKENGIDLIPESTEVRVNIDNIEPLIRRYGKFPEDFIWISVFDPHDLTAAWPSTHTGRLVRLIKQIGWQAVIPIPAGADVKRVVEMRELAKEAVFLDNPSAPLRAMGMSLSSLVIGQAGAETLLATFLGKKIVELHDMRSRRILNGDNFRNKDERKLKKAATYYTRTAAALKRNIMPPMHNCNEDCPSCAYNSCMEYISPERVFESVKRAVLPY